MVIFKYLIAFFFLFAIIWLFESVEMIKLSKTKFITIIWLSIIILMGFFLRVYHLDDWMHFQLDQSRDAYVIDEALEKGISHLPLLGPRAGGSFLRLGPAFYYMNYISAKIGLYFQQPSPIAITYGIMFFNVLSIWIFFLFLRRYFSRNISLGITALYSVSLFLVLYSRFSWNPNLLPFFIIFTLYALLKATDFEAKKTQKWFYLMVIGLSVVTQLHFLAFIILPLIVIIYLLIKWPTFNLKVYLTGLAILLFFYSPVMINEIKSGGSNTQEFFSTITKKSNQEKKGWINKIIFNTENHNDYYWLILTGWERGEIPRIIKSRNNNLKVQCKQECQKSLFFEILGLIIFLTGVFLILKKLWKMKKGSQKDFLLLVLIWFFVSFFVLTLLAHNLSPRFFLISAFLPFIFLGLVISFLRKNFSNIGIWLGWIIVASFIVSNLFFIYQRFQQLELASKKNIIIKKDKVLKEKTRVTWEQENLVANYLKNYYRKNNYPIYRSADPHYQRAIGYLLNKKKVYNKSIDLSNIYKEGNYFVIKTTSSGNKFLNKFLNKFILLETKKIGTLTIYHLKPRAEFINKIKENKHAKKRNNLKNKAIRYQWKDIF